ncbi:MAG TPA: glycosyltransferase [Rhizomicrobium sp.]|jgi:exo-beta-1,3-glucanase (GH17 family)/cellulose synthase/poly-beta-1,6-N-acetylglucosamine synthase-like glycosyltransferase|nr:glycosyltransferase [Rhizomicrobium sp.]
MMAIWRRAFSGGKLRIALALLLVVGASILFWASQDYAVIAPDWDGQVRGITYEPSHLFTDKDRHWISPEQIDRDLAQIAQLTAHVRTYTVGNGLDRVPEIARRHGLTVSLGLWIGPDLEQNEKEIAKGIQVALANRRVVDRVFVGNEAIQFGYVGADQLNEYIRRVRAALPNRIKVSTAEPWSQWLLSPELAQNVDFITVHLLPYWEGVPVRRSLDALQRFYGDVQEEFPDKPIVIGESGWPSAGRAHKGAEASPANQAWFIRNFVQLALEKGYDYYLVEAYDQPWKGRQEGAVGAYWGLFDANGTPKFAFTGMLRSFPAWRSYALCAALLSLLLGLLILGRMPRVRQPGYIVMGALVGLISTGLLVLLDSITLEYIQPSDLAMTLAMIPLVILAAAVVLTEGVELAASLWRVERRVVRAAIPEHPPRVSIHVPCYNEPPAMVIATLNALSRLDYDNFEVVVVDNNTADPAVWRPVEMHCAALGPRFVFHHLDGVKGFKAGALNEALRLCDPSATYIGVIDSDYQVEPYWLRRALPFFASSKVALVQCPQDYRDGYESIFKRMCFEEYRGFFRIGMVERNEHDAIIQHGTMTIVRRIFLQQVGGWSAWCITEDTELGLKLFEAGYGAAYIPESMGKGLTPDTLAAFMTQRYRWVYGAMQIMKRHAAAVFLGRTKLTWAQRYQFLCGWLPWISDGLGLLVTFFALIWTGLMTVAPNYFDVPMEALSAAALALFGAKTLKTLLLYPQKVGSGVLGAVLASMAGLALTHTVGKAVITGLATSRKPFLRTPKCQNPADLKEALRLVWQETSLLTLCVLAVTAMVFVRGFDDPAATLWMIMLSIQSLPYMATLVTACLSAVSYRHACATSAGVAVAALAAAPAESGLPKAA